MRKILLFAGLLLSGLAFGQQKSFYDFSTKDIDGNVFNLSDLKGKKVLVVNTASKCGLTPQYQQLQELYDKYGEKYNFVVLAFPANDFGGQEPGSNKEIKEFCSLTYDVTFPLMAKIAVSGTAMDPIYKWLTTKSENGVMDAAIQWNFQKFMINEHGQLVGMVPPKELPNTAKIVDWITGKNSSKK